MIECGTARWLPGRAGYDRWAEPPFINITLVARPITPALSFLQFATRTRSQDKHTSPQIDLKQHYRPSRLLSTDTGGNQPPHLVGKLFYDAFSVTRPWLRSLVAGLSPRKSGFASGLIRVGFVVDKVALGQVFLRVLLFSPVNIIPPSLSKLISSGECVIC
jgi:hypothetical protein